MTTAYAEVLEIGNRALLSGWTVVRQGADGALLQHRSRGLQVIVSIATEQDGKQWLHVSCVVRGQDRLPTWDELRYVKEAFVGRDRTALQVLPPTKRHVSIHDYCLHLWCCLAGDVTPDFTRGTGTI